MKSYYAHGKILLAGEYGVMYGLEALAFPVHLGQWMKVWETPSAGNSHLIWQAKDNKNQVWFECKIDTDILHVIDTTDESLSKTLIKLLRYASEQLPDFFLHKNIRVETELEFSTTTGLGSSSTLVSLFADWTGLNPLDVQYAVFGGSGYDVMVSKLGKPLVFWKENDTANWAPFILNPEFTKDWYVLFTGEKMNSRLSLDAVREKLEMIMGNPLFSMQLGQILNGLKDPKSTMLLEAGLEMWQGLMAALLGLPRPYDKYELKPIQGGLCKWLGAWGGDMILINKTMLDIGIPAFKDMEVQKWNEIVKS